MSETRDLARKRVKELLCRSVQNPSLVTKMNTEDLDLTLRLARRVRLLGRLAVKLKATGGFASLPDVAKDQLESAQVMANSRARLAFWELDRIAWALDVGQEVPLIVMKGCAYLLKGLPNSEGRIFADVDLLLPKSELEAVERALTHSGWQAGELTPYDQHYYRKWTHELPPLVHCDREVEIDLHHNIVPITARLNPPGDEFVANARRLENSVYWVMADEDIVLNAMTHLMFDSDLSDKLRELVDIADLLNHFADADSLFWEKFLARAPALDLARPAYYSLRYVSKLLNESIPDTAMVACRKWGPPRIAIWFMDYAVPRALFPQHPDLPSRLAGFCRLILYIRSHWIRMPPWLLAFHLTYKFVVTRFSRKPLNSG